MTTSKVVIDLTRDDDDESKEVVLPPIVAANPECKCKTQHNETGCQNRRDYEAKKIEEKKAAEREDRELALRLAQEEEDPQPRESTTT